MMGIQGSSHFLWLSAQSHMNYVHISVELLSFSSTLWSTKDKSCQGCHETFRGQSCKLEQDSLAGSFSSFACSSSFYVVRHTRHELPGICSRPWGRRVVVSVGSNAHIFKSDLLPDKRQAHSELAQLQAFPWAVEPSFLGICVTIHLLLAIFCGGLGGVTGSSLCSARSVVTQ